MSKTFSKIAIVFIVLANINSALAASNHQNIELSKQKLDYQENAQKIIVAGLFDSVIKTINDVNRTQDNINRRRTQQQEREQRLEERRIRLEMQQKREEQILRERQARQEEVKRRQEEYAAARRLATERQIQEAERRRQYFNSLSPEQKQAYIKQQQALRQKQLEATLFLFGLFMGSGGNNTQQQTTEYRYIYDTPTPTNNSAPATIKPIDPFYGDCHSYDCR
ncbi:MAG: hypothetical protein NHB32_22740 [Fischerella sp. CENA71]|nr:hypothetical protein [Fischerella sp. CENA71]